MASPYHLPLVLGAQTVDFAHLEPFSFEFESTLAKTDLVVHVTFTNHCFSKEYTPEEHPNDEPILYDGGRRPRTFCTVRYGLSHGLPAVIRELQHPRCKVWQTAARRNWAYSITVDDPQGPYHVFFEIRRAGKGLPQDLNLVVESAYHQTSGAPNLLGSMNFLLLCGKVYLNQPVATRR